MISFYDVVLFSAKTLIAHRQKLIRLADLSELGWRVVSEYEANPLASDSEDEKRIYRAEARANRRLKTERAKKGRSARAWPYRKGLPSTNSTSAPQMVQTTHRKPGLCFDCGKPGHWKKDPECQANQSQNKISTFVFTRKGNVNDTAANTQTDSDKGCFTECYKMSPAGRLKSHMDKWREATNSIYIRSIIENGYKLPLKKVPDSMLLRNNKSARMNISFVQEEIERLEKKKIISEKATRPYIVNPLTVAYNKKGKARLVLDCRHINEFLHEFKVKFEDIKIAEQTFDENSYLFTFDLKGAYHHIDIFEGHRTFLGFSYEMRGKTRFYVFNCLPFGIKTAGHIFTKVMRVVVGFIRERGYKVIMFLDDGIGGDSSLDSALLASEFTRRSLLDFGFLLADEKCQWLPNPRVAWLGHVLHMTSNRLYISEERVERLYQKIQTVLADIEKKKFHLIPVRTVANIVGQIVSMHSVMGAKTRLMTRYLFSCINSRASWNAPIIVTPEGIGELKFWSSNIKALNEAGKSIKCEKICNFSLFSDASNTGYGGYLEHISGAMATSQINVIPLQCIEPLLLNCSSPEVDVKLHSVVTEVTFESEDRTEIRSPEADLSMHICSPEVDNACQHTQMEWYISDSNNVSCCESEMFGLWSFAEQKESSTWKEAESIYRLIHSFSNALQNSVLRVYCDNKNVKSVLVNGSRVPKLHEIAVRLNKLCNTKHIVVLPEWIPRDANKKADFLSRCYDCDDWQISTSVFQKIDNRWGPHSIDRFASNLNNKCVRFNSRWWVPGTESIDCFSQYWHGERNWIVPPPRLISQCLEKIVREKASSTLIVPKWKSAAFWPLLTDKSGSFKLFIKDIICLGRCDVIETGQGNNGCFGKNPLDFDIIALNCEP